MRLDTTTHFHQRLRDACDKRPPPAHADRILRSARLHTQHKLTYDVSQFPLHTALAQLLHLTSLENLHDEIDDFDTSPEAHARVVAAKETLLAPLADADAAAPLNALYEELTRTVVVPHIMEQLEATDQRHRCVERVLFAATPTIRVQHPSALPTIRPHCDAQYSVPEGALNLWLPLTRANAAAASLWAESEAGSGDFAPLRAELGEIVRFDGRRCVHYTVPNSSGRTRISFDFRVVFEGVGGASAESGRLARLGYFSKLKRGGEGRRGEWVLFERGVVSKLHGLPHR